MMTNTLYVSQELAELLKYVYLLINAILHHENTVAVMKSLSFRSYLTPLISKRTEVEVTLERWRFCLGLPCCAGIKIRLNFNHLWDSDIVKLLLIKIYTIILQCSKKYNYSFVSEDGSDSDVIAFLDCYIVAQHTASH